MVVVEVGPGLGGTGTVDGGEGTGAAVVVVGMDSFVDAGKGRQREDQGMLG